MYWKSAVDSLVVFLLVSNLLASFCNGGCMSREARLLSSGDKPDGCMDGDVKRAFNSTWTKEICETCTCDTEGEISCCSRTVKPVLRNPACTAILNQTSCTYIIQRNDNSADPCES